MRIISLQSENIKRINAVRITPDKNIIVLGGDNGEGKTSVLDSIVMAMEGGKSIPATVLRKGAKEGKIVIDLGDYVVTRRFRDTGTKDLTVANADGAKYGTPQSILDGFYGKLSFDPLEFAKMGDTPAGRREQGEMLKKLAGLDFKDMEERRAEMYEERTAVNKEVDKFVAQLEPMLRHVNIPAEELSAADITAKITAATAHNNSIDDAHAAMMRVVEAGRTKATNITEQETKITRLRQELSDAEAALVTLNEEKTALSSQYDTARAAWKAMEAMDTAPLMADLTSINETNAKIRDNKAYAEKERELLDARTNRDHLNDAIAGIDKEKRDAIAAAKMPIDGLSFSDEGEVVFNGLPLDQASGAEQLRVSMAIGAALNPKLRVMLCKDGALLDNKSLALLEEFAQAKDYQIWLEDCRAGDRATVTIEDGEVKGAK